MEIPLDSLDGPPSEPFLDNKGPSLRAIEFQRLAQLPVSQSFIVDYEGDVFAVDSQDWRSSVALRFQIALGLLSFVYFGLADQTVGTIIPKLQEGYHISDGQVGYVFFATTVGYMCAAMASSKCHEMVGVRGFGIMGHVVMLVAFGVNSTKPPFWLYVLCNSLYGMGGGALDAAVNGWMGSLADSNQLLGLLHGCWGIGCMALPPFIAYLLHKASPWAWNNYYLLLCVFAVANGCIFAFFYRLENAAKFRFMVELKDARMKPIDPSVPPVEAHEVFHIPKEHGTVAQSEETPLGSGMVWFFSVFMFGYVGAEVAFGLWLITYLTRIKQFRYQKASFVATLFWTGLTLGRMALGFVTAHYFRDETYANMVYSALSFAGHLLFVFIAASKAAAPLFVLVFLDGFVVGPIFPTTVVSAIKILPAAYHTAGVGFICAFGGGGGAAVPFLVGQFAEHSAAGLRLFPSIVAAVFFLLLVSWFIFYIKTRKAAPVAIA